MKTLGKQLTGEHDEADMDNAEERQEMKIAANMKRIVLTLPDSESKRGLLQQIHELEAMHSAPADHAAPDIDYVGQNTV